MRPSVCRSCATCSTRPAEEWESERARTVEGGWVAELLSYQGRDGDWPEGRWTGSTWTRHWHYTVLRGLDYLRLTPAIHDKRLDDPIQLVLERSKPNGRWPLQKRIPGTLLVEMEKPGGESRWNTLRALRVLRRRDSAPAP
jgi:hypothetical protein